MAGGGRDTHTLGSFNQTSVELKLGKRKPAGYIFWPFNQTSVELKHKIYSFSTTCNCAFNQTSVELKHPCKNIKSGTVILLIRPVWN